MSEITQADRDAAASLIGKVGLSWSGDIIRQGRSDDHDYVKAFTAHRIAERERCAVIADDHVITADDDVQEAYARSAIDIAAAIRAQP